MAILQIVNLTKKFGNVTAIQEVNLKVEHGEVLTLLGPSGCGKTTTLRCIAGFEKPDRGDVYLDGKEITHLSPETRGIGMVFQNYALWPHMTVYGNLAFGLQIKKIPKNEINERIKKVLAMVRLEGFEGRFPRQMSGGQQQRIALARALVIEPSILLLDEPLSNLDAKLREQMRFEFRELQKKLGITAVYVTHDQAESLVLSDKVVILNEGKVMQVGTPKEIYSHPSNKFVAGFIGITSFIEGFVESFDREKGYLIIRTKDDLIIYGHGSNLSVGEKVAIAIRPEQVKLFKSEIRKEGIRKNMFNGEIVQTSYLGDVIDYRIRLGDWVIRTSMSAERAFKVGEEICVALSPENIIIVPEESE